MSFMDDLGDAGKSLFEKGKELGKAAKIKIEITTIEGKIGDYKKKIGDILYKEKIDVDNSEIKDLISKIDEANKQIEQKNIELKED